MSFQSKIKLMISTLVFFCSLHTSAQSHKLVISPELHVDRCPVPDAWKNDEEFMSKLGCDFFYIAQSHELIDTSIFLSEPADEELVEKFEAFFGTGHPIFLPLGSTSFPVRLTFNQALQLVEWDVVERIEVSICLLKPGICHGGVVIHNGRLIDEPKFEE